jgi:hypothetical protein
MTDKIKKQSLSAAIYKDDANLHGTDGIEQNKIVEIFNFLDKTSCESLIGYIESKPEGWGHVGSYAYRAGYFPNPDKDFLAFNLPENFCEVLVKNIKEVVEKYFLKSVSLNTIHAHKLGVGAVGHFHSDNTNEDGSPSHFDINKYAAIIYLNEAYSGGEILFPEHMLEIKPQIGSLLVFPGGKENIHGVREVISGNRYSLISFWDFSDSKYSEETEQWRAGQMEEWSSSWLIKWEKDWESKWKTWNFI